MPPSCTGTGGRVDSGGKKVDPSRREGRPKTGRRSDSWEGRKGRRREEKRREEKAKGGRRIRPSAIGIAEGLLDKKNL